MSAIDQSRLLEHTGDRRDKDRASNKRSHAKQFRNNEAARRHQDRVAEALVGRVQPASGAFVGAKGDVITRFFKVECKTTQFRSMSVKSEWLSKLFIEAEQEGQLPALALEFQQLSLAVGKEWVMLPLPVLTRLLLCWEQHEEKETQGCS